MDMELVLKAIGLIALIAEAALIAYAIYCGERV